MTGQPASDRSSPPLKRAEHGFESLLFNSRWLMAPFYFGLVISLAVLLLKFAMMLWEFVVHVPGAKESDIILGVLSLIDVSLTGNLILIVVFSGYENFVSRIDPGGHPEVAGDVPAPGRGQVGPSRHPVHRVGEGDGVHRVDAAEDGAEGARLRLGLHGKSPFG